MTRYTFLVYHIALKQILVNSDHELETAEHAEKLKQRLEEELGDGYEISYYESLGGPFPL